MHTHNSYTIVHIVDESASIRGGGTRRPRLLAHEDVLDSHEEILRGKTLVCCYGCCVLSLFVCLFDNYEEILRGKTPMPITMMSLFCVIFAHGGKYPHDDQLDTF